MSESYAKLFSTITTSTIWSEPMPTRVVWITMLAMADRHGEVHASVPGLARVANVSMDECLAALATFLAPDLYSRTPDNEGRRIAANDGGWCLLNHAKYRAKRDADDRKERQAQWIADKRSRASKAVDKSGGDENVDGSVDAGRQVDESRRSRHITASASASATKEKELQGTAPVGAPSSPDPEASKKKPKAKEQTLADWLASIGDADPIAATDPVVAEMCAAGVPPEFQALAWSMFCDQFDNPRKRQADWRAHFRNAIRGNWVKAWFFDDATGECRLTTAGKQAQRVHQSQGVES